MFNPPLPLVMQCFSKWGPQAIASPFLKIFCYGDENHNVTISSVLYLEVQELKFQEFIKVYTISMQ